MSRVRVPQHVARLVERPVVDYFAYAAHPGASARRTARRQLLLLRRASGCLGSSRGSSSTTLPRRLIVDYFASRGLSSTTLPTSCVRVSCGSLSTSSPMQRVRVPRHVARLVERLVVDYFAYAARPGASAHLAARRRLLRLRYASGCLCSSHSSSSTTSPRSAPRRLLHLMQARRRLLRLLHASGCLGTSRGSSSTTSAHAGSSSATSPMPRVWVPGHVVRLVVDHFTASRGSSHGSSRGSSSTTSPHAGSS
jgi:hypothetical protein